jgi:hypothetical protein
MFFRKKQSKKMKVAKLLMQRSLMYMCSYKKAWESWVRESEKENFAFEEIKEEIHKLKRS